jgi:hypothetical protein
MDDDDDDEDLSIALTYSCISYFHPPLIRLVAK